MDDRQTSVRVSKLLSLMLRHRPDEFGVEVDKYGYADLEAVLVALNEQDSDIEFADVEAVVEHGEKKRFEIEDGRIRARYGHSFPMELGIDPTEPPEFLYKGAKPSEVQEILEVGLKPEDRQYVHLSFEADVAERLGSGRRREPSAVIRVDALRAHQEGISFFDCGPTILVREVPQKFVVLEKAPERSSHISAASPAEAEGPVAYGRRRRFSGRR